MTAEQRTLLMDAGLSADARIIGLYLSSLGDGPHELARETFEDLLSPDAGKQRTQRAIGQLVRAGWILRGPGGRGHNDRYVFRCSATRQLNVAVDESPSMDRSRPTRQVSDSSRNSRHLSADSSRQQRHLSDVVVEEGVVVKPPISPLSDSSALPRQLSDLAESAIAAADAELRGCRGALRDYLVQRVPVDRQHGYVQTVVGWLNGLSPGVFKRSDGSSVPPERRTAVLADALNDLAASDESKLVRPIGEPANLRTKIHALLKRGQDGHRNGSDGHRDGRGTVEGGRNDRGAAGAASPADSDDDLSHLG